MREVESESEEEQQVRDGLVVGGGGATAEEKRQRRRRRRGIRCVEEEDAVGSGASPTGLVAHRESA
jgi:hypothetical protein